MSKEKEWAKDRKKLKVIYEEKGITKCELKFCGCWRNNALGFAHRHKRNWYLDKPELLGEFDQTILACNFCHDIIEDDKKLTEEVFKKLRPENERME